MYNVINTRTLLYRIRAHLFLDLEFFIIEYTLSSEKKKVSVCESISLYFIVKARVDETKYINYIYIFIHAQKNIEKFSECVCIANHAYDSKV